MAESARSGILGGVIAVALFGTVLVAQTATTTQKPVEPRLGQPGKDVIWVPTLQPVVEAMLDIAKLTKDDFLIDLGSGDGVTVITAARRGARALGIEFDRDLVVIAQQRAKDAGVAARATFVQGDFFKTDFSKATVLTLFLHDTLNRRLRPLILEMQPGTRVVTNTFRMGSGADEWRPEAEETVAPCQSNWCTALLYVVPAKVAGVWKTEAGTLTLTQKFQMLTGTLGTDAITEGKLLGYDISFTAGGQRYAGTVSKDGRMIRGTTWRATR
jgi:hypothetical protein